MKEIQYDLNVVIGHLSAKIANLETQLAHMTAINEAYAKKINELEEKLKENITGGIDN